ncbi:GNAT family N-acetyltransferase [Dietzia sp. PP-33]|jgi:ribosomal protein S18 acetylase RimI-like enzyme|uniref:GNAT family N-acetyltransferase n=1 Tax=Dietzia sp. PP-33 TaxID=2957500 RepID=UPI0029B4CFC5|nr:GNAT family N-acetyltransferase [Dietzia sp. PP-33]MDX2358346.1 GNAT family N-acetyltransferase [Dietzia sp. PP-33]
MTDPRLASPDDLAPAAETLAEAFAHYPWTRHVIPEEGYADRLLTLQHLYLAHAHRHGIVAVDTGRDGVIALLPPDAPDPDDATLDQIVALHGDRIDRLAHGSAPHDGWTLETLGVRPSAQGRRLGSALIGFGLDEAARRGARTVRLDTSDERNVRLYERHGFHVNDRSDRPGGPPVWHMEVDVLSR